MGTVYIYRRGLLAAPPQLKMVEIMNTLNAMNKFDFECSFHDDIDGHTFVVSVDLSLKIGEHEETANFLVNCQFADADTYRVSCRNESGCDYRDSGLAAWIEDYELDEYEDMLCKTIEDCAQSQADLQRQTVEQYLALEISENLY